MQKFRVLHPNGANQEEFTTLEAAAQRRQAIALEYGVDIESILIEVVEFTLPEEPEEAEPPDWQGFMDALDLPPTGNGLFQAMLEANPPIALHSYQLCLAFLKGLGTEKELRTLTWLYGVMANFLTEVQQQELQAAIAQFRIPTTS